jgi:hypothetical protein
VNDIELFITPGLEAEASLTAIKQVAAQHPGTSRLTVVTTNFRLRLGERWAVDDNPECRAALNEFGRVKVAV